MKLTIGMIVKNEEKYLERCLTAIKPILDNVDSELIITDTGSTDRTVEIAERFTDKIIHFEWINDFAAARNTAIEAAQGEWFMFLDADEFFLSCDELISFFNSGEYKNYRSATFKLRNLHYNDDKSIGYNMFYPSRLVKRTDKTRFEGNIHEFLSPFDDPQKIINDTVDHYGYLYENEEAVQKKFKRNSELLLKMIENKDTAAPLTYLQLYETFILAERYDEAMQYIDEGIECARKRNNNCLAVLYYQKAITFYKYKKYDEILKVYNDYFNMSKVIRPKELSTDGEMYAVMAEALYLTGRYDEAIKEYRKFFEIYPKIASGKLVTNDAFLTSSSFCADVMIIPLFNDFLDCCIHSEKYNTAESQMITLPLYRYEAAQKHIVRLARQEIVVLDKLEYKSAAKVYERLNDDCKNAFIIYLVSEVISSQKKTEIIKALSVMSKADKKITNALNAAEIITEAVNLRSQKKYKECISEMKRAVTIYEPIAPIISEYCNDVVAEYERETKAEPQDEMQKLAAAIKNNIRAYVEAGNIEAARKTLDEFRKIMPGDPEIKSLESRLG